MNEDKKLAPTELEEVSGGGAGIQQLTADLCCWGKQDITCNPSNNENSGKND